MREKDDVSRWSLEELRDAQRHVDRVRFPTHAAAIDQWARRRSLEPADVQLEATEDEIRTSRRDLAWLLMLDILTILSFIALYLANDAGVVALFALIGTAQLACVCLLVRGAYKYRVRVLRSAGVFAARMRLLQWPVSVVLLWFVGYGFAVLIYGKG